MKVEVMRGIRMEVRNEGLGVAVESAGGFVVDPWAVAVTHDVILDTCDGKNRSRKAACIEVAFVVLSI